MVAASPEATAVFALVFIQACSGHGLVLPPQARPASAADALLAGLGSTIGDALAVDVAEPAAEGAPVEAPDPAGGVGAEDEDEDEPVGWASLLLEQPKRQMPASAKPRTYMQRAMDGAYPRPPRHVSVDRGLW